MDYRKRHRGGGDRKTDRQTDCQMATEATEQAANTLDCRKSAGREQCVQKLLMNDVSSLIIMRTHSFAHTPSKCINFHRITLDNDGKPLKIINLQKLDLIWTLVSLVSICFLIFLPHSSPMCYIGTKQTALPKVSERKSTSICVFFHKCLCFCFC